MNKTLTLFLILAIVTIIVGCVKPQVEEKEPVKTLTEETEQIIDDVDTLDDLDDAELDKEMDDLENVLDQI